MGPLLAAGRVLRLGILLRLVAEIEHLLVDGEVAISDVLTGRCLPD